MPRYQAAKDLLLKADFEQGAGFQTFAGVQTRSIKFPDTTVKVTNADSEGNFRELVQGVGEDSMDFDADGVFVSGPLMVQMFAARRAGRLLNMQVVVPGLGTYEGKFAIGSLELSGGQNDELKFRCSFMSAGPLGFTPNTAL
jgi:predicted secreted protein